MIIDREKMVIGWQIHLAVFLLVILHHFRAVSGEARASYSAEVIVEKLRAHCFLSCMGSLYHGELEMLNGLIAKGSSIADCLSSYSYLASIFQVHG